MKALTQSMRRYDAITGQRICDQWTVTMALAPERGYTLDFYYSIYQLLEEYEPQRSRGYRSRFCYNPIVCEELRRLGYLKHDELLKIDTLKNAIRMMEGTIWVR